MDKNCWNNTVPKEDRHCNNCDYLSRCPKDVLLEECDTFWPSMDYLDAQAELRQRQMMAEDDFEQRRLEWDV